MKRFEYIGLHNTDNGYMIDDFTLYAEIVSKTEDTITYNRYQKFGKIESKKGITIPIEEFNRYYSPMTDEQYNECLKKEK